MKNLKKNLFGISLAFSMILGITFSSIPQEAVASPCPTGFSSVTKHWFGRMNLTTYTLCGCQAIKGISASGSCGGGGAGIE